jgi:serine/threonine protein kinase
VQDANERGWFKTEPSQKNGKPDLSIILATALELAQAMEHLHALSIVHGDLTPFNVLLSKKATSPHGFTVKVPPPPPPDTVMPAIPKYEQIGCQGHRVLSMTSLTRVQSMIQPR